MEYDDERDTKQKQTIKFLGLNSRRQQKSKSLKQLSDIESNAFEELKQIDQECIRLTKHYRPIGFESSNEALAYLVNLYDGYIKQKDDLNGLELSIIEQIVHSADWLLRGMYGQESLLDSYIKKFRDLEAVHNITLRYVNHAISLYYKVLGDILWLKQIVRTYNETTNNLNCVEP